MNRSARTAGCAPAGGGLRAAVEGRQGGHWSCRGPSLWRRGLSDPWAAAVAIRRQIRPAVHQPSREHGQDDCVRPPPPAVRRRSLTGPLCKFYRRFVINTWRRRGVAGRRRASYGAGAARGGAPRRSRRAPPAANSGRPISDTCTAAPRRSTPHCATTAKVAPLLAREALLMLVERSSIISLKGRSPRENPRIYPVLFDICLFCFIAE